MSKLKMLGLCTIFILLVTLFSSTAFSLGVTPGRSTVIFEPGVEKSLSFDILNSENKDLRLLVYARGELKDYISFDKNIVELSSSESKIRFTYKVNLPSDLEPGTRTADIVIVQIPKENVGIVQLPEDGTAGDDGVIFAGQDGAVISTAVAVVSQLYVKVPYPGKYIDLNVHVEEARPGETTSFIVSMFNLGKEDIARARASVDVYGPTNERIASLSTDEIPLKTKEAKELKAHWISDVNPGKYLVRVTAHYDEKVKTMEKVFSVGNVYVDITDVLVKDFSLGDIAKFTMELESKWNDPLTVSGEMIVLDDEDSYIATLNSPSTQIDALSRRSLDIFWDTEGISEGTYRGDIKLAYADRETKEKLDIFVGLNRIETRLAGQTGRVVQVETPNSGINSFLVIVVMLLVVINVGWFIYMRRGKKPPKQKEEFGVSQSSNDNLNS